MHTAEGHGKVIRTFLQSGICDMFLQKSKIQVVNAWVVTETIKPYILISQRRLFTIHDVMS